MDGTSPDEMIIVLHVSDTGGFVIGDNAVHES